MFWLLNFYSRGEQRWLGFSRWLTCWLNCLVGVLVFACTLRLPIVVAGVDLFRVNLWFRILIIWYMTRLGWLGLINIGILVDCFVILLFNKLLLILFASTHLLLLLHRLSYDFLGSILNIHYCKIRYNLILLLSLIHCSLFFGINSS